MRDSYLPPISLCVLLISLTNGLFAQNPIITDQFTADPSARVFEGKVYLYPSHDILAREGRGRPGWFCMEDYHVFSTSNLTDWKDEGVIVSQVNVPWVNPKAYALWAPDCISRNEKYYFYFPAPARDSTYGRGFSIGVAISDRPSGPFIPQPEPIKGVHGIDPNVLVDQHGQAYLYWAARNFFVAKLKDNMLELDGEPRMVEGLPAKGLKEGPFFFERNSTCYLIYPHVQDTTERLEYAVSDNPMGPFTVKGVLMDETPGCWTNQASVIEFHGQWFLFYHSSDLSPRFDKNRSVRIDSLFFNEDGTIKKVIPTMRGVGVTEASGTIQVDRYSAKSGEGASVAFLDTLNRFEGWKAVLDVAGAWIQYDAVNFGSAKTRSVRVKARSATGGTLEIRLDNRNGPPIAVAKCPKGNEWSIVQSSVSQFPAGMHDLIVTLEGRSNVEIDWVSFN